MTTIVVMATVAYSLIVFCIGLSTVNAMFEAYGWARMYGLSQALSKRLLVYNVAMAAPAAVLVYASMKMVFG